MSQLALGSLVGNARGRLGRASRVELTGTQFRLFTFVVYDVHIHLCLLSLWSIKLLVRRILEGFSRLLMVVFVPGAGVVRPLSMVGLRSCRSRVVGC